MNNQITPKIVLENLDISKVTNNDELSLALSNCVENLINTHGMPDRAEIFRNFLLREPGKTEGNYSKTSQAVDEISQVFFCKEFLINSPNIIKNLLPNAKINTYIHIPKTGGSTISNFFSTNNYLVINTTNFFGGRFNLKHTFIKNLVDMALDKVSANILITGHKPLPSFSDYKTFHDGYVFTSIRDPLDYFFSVFNYTIKVIKANPLNGTGWGWHRLFKNSIKFDRLNDKNYVLSLLEEFVWNKNFINNYSNPLSNYLFNGSTDLKNFYETIVENNIDLVLYENISKYLQYKLNTDIPIVNVNIGEYYITKNDVPSSVLIDIYKNYINADVTIYDLIIKLHHLNDPLESKPYLNLRN